MRKPEAVIGHDPGVVSRRGALIAVALTVVALFAYIRPPGVATGIDYVLYHSLDRHYWMEAVRQLRLPLWNPHVGLGRPFAGDIQTVTFYPGTLTYLLGAKAGLATSVLLHVFVVAAGMRLLARRIGVAPRVADVLAFAAAFVGPVAARMFIGHMAFADSVVYIPLAFAMALSVQDAPSLRTLAALGAVLGLQILAGHPQVGWVTWFSIALFLLGRRVHALSWRELGMFARDLGLLAAAVAWALGIAGIVILPLLELVGQSNRSAPTLAFASSFPLPPFALASLFFVMDEQVVARALVHENNIYAGVVVALAGFAGLFAVRRREATGLAFVLLGTLLLALGRATPLFAGAYYVLPGLSAFRVPARIAITVPFALLALAGLFLSDEGPSPGRRRAPVLAGALGAAAVCLLVPGNWPSTWTLFLVRLALVGAGSTLLVLWTVRPSARAAVGLALVVLLACDLGQAVRVWRDAFFEPVPPAEAAVAAIIRRPELAQAGGAPVRILVPPELVRNNAGMLLGYSTPNLYVALCLDRVWTYAHEGIGVGYPVSNSYLADEVFARPFPYNSVSQALGTDRRERRFIRREPDPRVYVTPEVERVETWREAIRRMAAGHDFHQRALVEAAFAGAVPAQLSPGTARLLSFAPERIVVDVASEGGALVALGEPWYPGWRAFVGGREVPSLPLNGWMRGAVVPGGRQELVFTYHSRLLLPGALVSLASVAAIGVAFRRTPRAA